MRTTVWIMLAMLVASCGRSKVHHHAEVRHSLHSGWTFSETGTDVWHPAEVPGTVHTDLMRAGLIPDPYHGTNIDSVQWVGERDWTYRIQFDAPEDLLDREHVLLEFEGLDTYASVSLNAVPLGDTYNMHRTWRFPLQHVLRGQGNLLEIRFRSAMRMGEELLTAYGRSLPADNDQGAVKVAPFVRKAGVHFGWDFAPRLVTSGIWRAVTLRGWDGARIQQVRIAQHASEGMRTLAFHAQLDGALPPDARLRVVMDNEIISEGSHVAPLTAVIPDTGLWWPAGYGEQQLRDLRVELLEGDVIRSTWDGRIGLRDIELRQEPDSFGTSFTFLVNGRPIFALGANVVPPDQFLPRAGDSAWIALVEAMRDSHMNMARVWGGGVYAPDVFFDACDEAGILVWQDLMFANTMVPDDEAFMDNVRQEVEEQVGRLQHRTSLALWCGNNEIDVAWHNWGWQHSWSITPDDSTRMWNAYQGLFEQKLPAWIAALDDRPYIPTSPLSNWGNSEGLRHGDLHYWGVWHGDALFETFQSNVGRFVSEYGFQSYPVWETLAEYASEDDLAEHTQFWRTRQLSYKGDAAIERLAQHYLGPVRDRRDLVEKSQELQALAYAMAIDAHWAERPRCMGTLLWQLNDVWPGASWSIIDHKGRRKPAFHAVREAYGRAR